MMCSPICTRSNKVRTCEEPAAPKRAGRAKAGARVPGFTALVAVLIGCGAAIAAQGLDPAALLKPSPDSWPTYHGDYSGKRHTTLTQITPANVHQLTLAWAFQTGGNQQIKGTPILVNGVIYLTTPDNLWAIDARSARQIWRYT